MVPTKIIRLLKCDCPSRLKRGSSVPTMGIIVPLTWPKTLEFGYPYALKPAAIPTGVSNPPSWPSN